MPISNLRELTMGADSESGPVLIGKYLTQDLDKEVASLDLTDLMPSGPGNPPLINGLISLLKISMSQENHDESLRSCAERVGNDLGIDLTVPELPEDMKALNKKVRQAYLDLRGRHLEILNKHGGAADQVMDAYKELDRGTITLHQFYAIAKLYAKRAFTHKYMEDRLSTRDKKILLDPNNPELQTVVKELATILQLMDDAKVSDDKKAMPTSEDASRIVDMVRTVLKGKTDVPNN